MTRRLLDVLGPALVIADRIDAESEDLAAALVELGLETGHVAELGRANRGEILRVRKQNRPPRADPVVEVDLPLRGVGGEIGCFAVDPQCHVFASVVPISSVSNGRNSRLLSRDATAYAQDMPARNASSAAPPGEARAHAGPGRGQEC